MKRAVSVSLGSSKRNKTVEIELLGEKISIERIGTDGDMEKAAQLYAEMDGKVDAFGVGGTDLGLLLDDTWYPLHSINSMVNTVKQTPLVDGSGLKMTLEKRVILSLEDHLKDYLDEKGRKAFVTTGVDRWGMTKGFLDGGYECVFGDLMFGTGLPIGLRTEASLKRVASLAMPIISRLPYKWLYPTGKKQEVRNPKFVDYYKWATVLAGDRHYVIQHLPDGLDGPIVVTNTTTETDVEICRGAGVKYLVTTTPVIEGRSFGTNMMEAALIAISGKGRKLTYKEYGELLDQLNFELNIMELN